MWFLESLLHFPWSFYHLGLWDQGKKTQLIEIWGGGERQFLGPLIMLKSSEILMLQNTGGKTMKNSKKAPNFFWVQPVSLFESVCKSCLLSASDSFFRGFLGCIFWLYLCCELLYSLLGVLEVGGCVVYICGLIANSFPANIQYLKSQLGWLAVNAHICCVALFQFLNSMSITTVAVWILKSIDGVWKAPVFFKSLWQIQREG